MLFPISHTTEEKLKSLSERLKYLARDTNSARLYIDQNVRSENLKLNLSLVFSHIILNLHFIERSKSVFEKIIEGYNQVNNTILSFEDFEKVNWIREIAGEILIPELVRHFVWQVGYNEKGGKPIVIPYGKNDLIRCLQIYYHNCFEESKLTITKEELEKILNNHASKEVTADFLIEREIIGLDTKNDVYYWKDNDYLTHLRNEIASTLWLLVGGEEANEAQFMKYFKLIQGAGIWIDNLQGYLNFKNTSKICEFAVSFLQAENDLLKSDNEFRKIWLDAESYQHIDLDTEIPIVEFNYSSPYDFIESVNYHKWRFRDTFSYQRTRSFCHSLIRLIVVNDPIHPKPYQNALGLIRDTKRPFLLWTLYQDIHRNFPFLIPYLLTDSELIPIAFKLIDKIEIDNVLLSEQSNNDRKIEECCEVKNQFWLEMFEFILEQLVSVHSDNKEVGELLAKVLIDIAEKVFSINSNNRNSVINHNSLRKRYDAALKKLSSKRITEGNTYPRPPINSRLIFSVLPNISNYLKEKNLKKNPNHTEFLNLKSGLIDLYVEILRLANLRISETEISEEQKEKIKITSTDLVSLLQNSINQFYSAIEIDVQVYNSAGIEKKKAKRGISEFGFEIIDWGYLYLHFEKSGVLQSITNNFITSLNFDIDKDKYDEQNKEQFEKIKLYLKSLMLAFISINQKRDLYEIDELPVKSTLGKLENWIQEFSLKYSIDEITKKRIDVFNERFSVFGYDMYYQQLTTLLYRSINYFKTATQNKFVEDFFVKSIDTGRMLTAINILDSKELRDIISKRINEVNIEDFIESSFTTTELQYALVEAVNSDNHWELAKPLIKRIQEHFKSVKHNDENITNFLFEINLLLAFKEKDFDKLINLPVPIKESHYQSGNRKVENIKRFFIALYKLYNDKKYNEAILILKSLLSEETKNIRYAFHLYRAETLKAVETE